MSGFGFLLQLAGVHMGSSCERLGVDISWWRREYEGNTRHINDVYELADEAKFQFKARGNEGQCTRTPIIRITLVLLCSS